MDAPKLRSWCLAVGALLTAGSLFPAPSAAAPFVRREIHKLSAPQVDAYRKGVALMMSRPQTDPTSWLYQSNIHGFPTDPSSFCGPIITQSQPAWASCQHGQFFFLAWHRMYLYYFEQILRAAVRTAMKNPTYDFALPYWDYAADGVLPEPFRKPGDASNKLFVAERAWACNQGLTCVDMQTASSTVAMTRIPFCNCVSSGACCPGCTLGQFPDQTFGGQLVSQPMHFNNRFGMLERQPHNVVHNAIGGPSGWMTDPDCAARDPIFWVHHANIDRLWQVWLNQGGGRANPIDCKQMTGPPFTFFDAAGKQVTMTACDVLDMASQLDYVYEELPVNNVQLCSSAGGKPAPAPPPPPKVLTAMPEGEVNLGNAQVTVRLPLDEEARTRLGAIVAAEGETRALLVVEGIQLLRMGANFAVYLNVPTEASPNPESPNFVGLIGLFGKPEHGDEAVMTFDITDKLELLRAAAAEAPAEGEGEASEAGEAGESGEGGATAESSTPATPGFADELTVTFVRHNLDSGESPAASEPFIRFSRVSLVEQPAGPSGSV